MCRCRVGKSIVLLYRESFWLVSKIIEVSAFSNKLFKQICKQPNEKKTLYFSMEGKWGYYWNFSIWRARKQSVSIHLPKHLGLKALETQYLWDFLQFLIYSSHRRTAWFLRKMPSSNSHEKLWHCLEKSKSASLGN